MGSFPKQLLLLNGKWLLQHVIDNALDSNLGDLVIVLGHEFAQVRELIFEGMHGQVILNPHYRKGQSTSVRAGISSVAQSMDAAMVLLGDQPGVTSAVIDHMIDAYAHRRSALVVPRYAGQPGNPVIIDRSLFPEIRDLKGDAGAKPLFQKHASETEYVDFDFPAPPDIDTHDDLESMKAMLPD